MAKISNTTSYPQVVPSLDDYVIGTHIAGTPTNQTTNFKISDIQTAILTLADTKIWVGNSLDAATPTDLISINLITSDIGIGSPTSKTSLKGTLAAGVTYPTGTNNIALGLNSLNINNTTGSRNSALGIDSGKDVTTGSDNTLIGNGSGVGLAATSGNTLIGASSIIKDPFLTDNATAVGFESECGESGVAIGYKSSALSGGVSLGAEATSESECIAIGYSSTANVHPTTNNPLINFRGNLINDLVAQNTIYADNTAAIADGLKAGDVYLLDNTTIGIAAVGATAGPAIMCVAYTP